MSNPGLNENKQIRQFLEEINLLALINWLTELVICNLKLFCIKKSFDQYNGI